MNLAYSRGEREREKKKQAREKMTGHKISL